MTKTMFEQWLRLVFIPSMGEDRPVLLLMDNHGSHISTAASNLAREYQVYPVTNIFRALIFY
jgi:hypothetical protein